MYPKIVRWVSSNWLALGFALITVVLLVTQIGFREKSTMKTYSISHRVLLVGSEVSLSGFRVATEISHETSNSKEWPYLIVEILDREGARLYQSRRYAAWFEVRLCWDDANRLWIVSKDTGTEIVALSPNGWSRYSWMPGLNTETVLDVESGDRLTVVDWEPPSQIRGFVEQ